MPKKFNLRTGAIIKLNGYYIFYEGTSSPEIDKIKNSFEKTYKIIITFIKNFSGTEKQIKKELDYLNSL